MCGIVALLGAPATAATAVDDATAMCDAIAQRGPDGSGIWADPDGGIVMGQRRLAVVDLSPTGAQPMEGPGGRWVITFNGEIYNHRDIRRDLEHCGATFRGTSDTEVLLTAVAEWGVAATLRRADGMFAFALWDRANRELTVARDRFGEKPLVVGRTGGGVAIASDTAALRAHRHFDRTLDPEAIAGYLRTKVVAAPFTVHRDARKVLPGTFEVFALGDPWDQPSQRHHYYDAVAEATNAALQPFTGSPGDAVDQADELIRASVRRRMVADVPVGAFLSGGTDSRTVVAAMVAESTAPVVTFTIGSDNPDYDETHAARASATHWGTQHHELVVTERDALAEVPRICGTADEPFGDSSLLPTRLVSALARRDVTVALSGDGGDEVFGGYERYEWIPKVNEWATAVPAPARRVAAAVSTRAPTHLWDDMGQRLRIRRLGQKIHKAATSLGEPDGVAREWRVLEHWPNAERLVVGAPSTASASTWRNLPGIDHVGTRMAARDLGAYLPDDILAKVDRAAMSVSLETRVPLLAPDVVNFGFTLPADLRRRDGRNKWVLVEVLRRSLPNDLVDQPKAGFGLPIDEWLRGGLRTWADALLAPDALRQVGLHPEPVRAVWERHCRGAADAGSELWTVLMFVAWHQQIFA